MKIAKAIAGAGGLAAAAMVTRHFIDRRPGLPTEEHAYVASVNREPSPERVLVSFGCVSTLAISDGETTLVTDGFFSRPSTPRMLLGPVPPSLALIRSGLRRLGVSRADAVVVAHSHYDHAMDSPVVARETGAKLIGSESTRWIGRGYGLPEEDLIASPRGNPCVSVASQ